LWLVMTPDTRGASALTAIGEPQPQQAPVRNVPLPDTPLDTTRYTYKRFNTNSNINLIKVWEA